MPRVEDLPETALARALACGRFRLHVGDTTLRIDSDLPEFAPTFGLLYGRYPCSTDGGEFDYDVAVTAPSFLRRWVFRNALFRFSGDVPFLPMPVNHSHALFEWGANWVIGAHAHRHLIIHAAVLERLGSGVLFVAVSGGGKSTLAAELSLSGWRLLSDEMALLDGPPLQLTPHPRPISLKNRSIELIRSRHPDAAIGPVAVDTHKGTIAHLRAPDEAIDRASEPANPALIVFPRWAADASLQVRPVGAGDAAMRIVSQCFNYPVLGEDGFERLALLVKSTPAVELEYASLDDARRALTEVLA